MIRGAPEVGDCKFFSVSGGANGNPPDLGDLIRERQGRIIRVTPAGGPRGAPLLAVAPLVGLTSHDHEQ